MNKRHYAKLFRLLDSYAKRHHACFLTELFVKSDETGEYYACFRPQIFREDTSNQCACRYLTMELSEVREMLRTGLLQVSVATVLDEKLASLNLEIKAR